jgi:hypothetical protein
VGVLPAPFSAAIVSQGKGLSLGSDPHEVLFRLTKGSIVRVSHVFLLAIFLGGRPAGSIPYGYLMPGKEVRLEVWSA